MGMFDRDGNYVTAEDVLDEEELAAYYAHSNRRRPRSHRVIKNIEGREEAGDS